MSLLLVASGGLRIGLTRLQGTRKEQAKPCETSTPSDAGPSVALFFTFLLLADLFLVKLYWPVEQGLKLA